MARHDDDGCGGKDCLTTRRALMKSAGVTALALGAGSALGTAGATSVSGTTQVDLGEEGLTNGDSIDAYLQTHFDSDTVVHIPAGEYTYTGVGLSGSYSNAGLLGSSAGVVLRRPTDSDTPVRPTMTATDGSVRVENVTIEGIHGQAQSRWRVAAESGARMELLNVNMPDGGVEDSQATGIYAGTDHAGTLWVNHCHFSNFGNVALDVSDPYKGENGTVVVEDSDFVDTGAAAVELGADNSVVRGCYFEATDSAAIGPGKQPQHAIVVDGPGKNVVIDDCDFNWTDTGSAPIDFTVTSAGGDGVISNVRTTDPGTGLISADWDVDSAWSGENIDVTEV